MASNFDDSPLGRLARQQSNRAAPEGLRQTARAASGYMQGQSSYANSTLGKLAAQNGYGPTAKSWYGGANQQGLNNGWDTEFTQKFMDGQNKAGANGTLGEYFESKDATGVVLWDHESSSGDKSFQFGDIYEDGKKVGNVYDDFDKYTADLMMLEWTSDGKAKAKAFGSSDPEFAVAREVENFRETNNRDIPKAIEALRFQGAVEDRAKQFQEGGIGDSSFGVDEATVLGAAGTTAGVGAGIGSMITPGVGTLIGGGIGAGVGFIGGLLNKDSLTNQAARAYELVSLRRDEDGLPASVFEGLSQGSQLLGKFASPLSNIVQGSYDAAEGEIGDLKSEFYAVDKEGNPKRPTWVKVADLGASVGDMAAMFASPLGAQIYIKQMQGTILGEVGALTFSGGKTFDDRRGNFDNIFTDDEGNFDVVSAAAGIGNIGIDMVQLGMAKGLMGKTDQSLIRTGQEAVYGSGGGRIAAKLQNWRTSPEARAALASGGRQVEVGGMRYVMNAEGQVVQNRMTISMLAPSEQLAHRSAIVMARRAAAKKGQAVSADDVYAAANALAIGESKLRTSIVNGLGEGYEEAAQAVLEPLSHHGKIDGRQVAEAFFAGSASGFGMGLGTSYRASTAAERMFSEAQAQFAEMTGGDTLTREEWDNMDDHTRRMIAAGSKLGSGAVKAAYKKISEDQAREATAGVAGVARLQDAIQTVLVRELAKATDRTDGAFTISQVEEATGFPSNAVASSANQLRRNLIDHLRGAAIQLEQLVRDGKEIQAEVTARGPVAEGETDALQSELDQNLAQQDEIEQVLVQGRQMLEQISPIIESLAEMTDAEQSATIAQLNTSLARAFTGTETIDGEEMDAATKRHLARAVSFVFTRDPQDQAGSYQILMPQISEKLTRWNADNVLEINSAVLMGLSADFDGDKIRMQSQLILDETEFVNLRSGMNMLGVGETVNIGIPKYEKYMVEQLSEALNSSNQTIRSYGVSVETAVATAIRKRYDGVIEDHILGQVLEAFFRDVKAGVKDARSTLLDGLAKKAGGEITAFARGNMSNEWLWLDQLVRAEFQKFQEVYVLNIDQLRGEVNTNTPTPHLRAAEVAEVRQTNAAVLGQTVSMLLSGNEPFRQAQKLHFSSVMSPVVSADGKIPEPGEAQLAQLVLLYESLGSGISQQAVAEIRGKDEITSRAFAQLMREAQKMAKLNGNLSPMEAFSILANTEVYNIDIQPDGKAKYAGNTISLAQMILKQEVARDAKAKSLILEASPELQAKHARLLAMTRPGSKKNPVNAERAFVEIISSSQFFTLLGEDAQIFGPHLTVEQYIREYVSLNEAQRSNRDAELHSQGAYLGRKRSKNMPYSVDEIGDPKGGLTAFRVIADAITAVGHNRLTMDKSGKLHGEVADQSDKTSKAFRGAHKTIRQALLDFASLSPRKTGELPADFIARVLENNKDFARDVMALIPNDAARAVFKVTEDNKVLISNWVYETFAMQDPKEAEMHFWRNLLIAEWHAMGSLSRTNEKGEVEEVDQRQFDKLPRRMHRVLSRLAHMNDGGLQLQQFIIKMEESKDLDAFFKWVNTNDAVRGMDAPLTAWVDDVSEFDADKAGGGWTQSLRGAELREAIKALRDNSQRLVQDLSEEKRSLKADTVTAAAVRRVMRSDAGDTKVQLEQGDRELHDRFIALVEDANERFIGLGPSAMIHQSIGAVWGFYARAHTKGLNPRHVEAAGMLDATRDAFDFVTNYERLMASMTSVNLEALGNNLSELAKDDVRSMDEFGREVAWTKPTPEQLLDMLESAENRPLARAILFPQVLERTADGVSSMQLLHGKSLTAMLNKSTYGSLFPKADKLSQDAALRYLSDVEAQARKHGGHFSVQRAINDLVIAQTSAANTELSISDVENMVQQAYYDAAHVLQAAGTALSMPSDTDYLAEIADSAKQTYRNERLRTTFNLDTDVLGMTTEEALNALVTAKTEETKAAISDLIANQDPMDPGATDEQVLILEEERGRFIERLEALRDDDVVNQVVSMFSVPKKNLEAAAAKKTKLIEFLGSHLNMLERVSGSKPLIQKITDQMLTPDRDGQVDLTADEWDELSRAVIAVYLDDIASRTGSNVSVAPFPDADHVNDHKYYDITFSYVLDPLFSSDSPLVKAARDIALKAGRLGDSITLSEAENVIANHLFKKGAFGQWTGEVPRWSRSANERLDSSPAAMAITMSGNSPKRQAVISAATARTFVIPDENLLSTVKLTGAELQQPSGLPMQVEFAGGHFVDSREKIQLNNRFAKSAVATLPDGTQVDLMTMPNVGRVWHGNAAVASSGYSEIHPDRLAAAVLDVAGRNKVAAKNIQVEIQFFHPDSQPSGAEWYNNIFFEGTSFKVDGDFYDSLNASLWFSPNGINQSNQRNALDASKTGESAIKEVDTVDSSDRASLEADWAFNLPAVLHAKTMRMLDTDLGFGNLEPEFYNAVYKGFKMRHFVRGLDENGNTVLWTAEQVIEFQQNNLGAALPLQDPKLFIPTDNMLRSMLGEQGNQGVAGFFYTQTEVDLSDVKPYQGVTQEMLDQFVPIDDIIVDIRDTSVANRSRQTQLTVRPFLSDAQRNVFEARMTYLKTLQAEGWTDRAEIPQGEANNFNAAKNLQTVIELAQEQLSRANISLDWASIMPVIGPRDANSTLVGQMLLRDLGQAISTDNPNRTGFIYEENATASPTRGILSKTSISSSDRAGYRVIPGDLVAVKVDTFNGDLKLAKKRADWLIGRGATVVLVDANGRDDLITELGDYLESGSYERVAGSKHVYQPADLGSRYQNQKARLSTLVETHGIRPNSQAAIFLGRGLNIEENAAYTVLPVDERLGAVSIAADIIPSDAFAGYNVPVPAQLGQVDQIEVVRQRLIGLNTEEGIALLMENSVGQVKNPEDRVRLEEEFRESWDRLMQRFDNYDGVVLPQPGDTFGVGDIIPLTDASGTKIILYRHGMSAPLNREAIQEQQASVLPGESDGIGVAVYSAKRENDATSHTGEVVEFNPRSGFGLSVELRIPLQAFGDKKLLEWNGMKYILIPKPDSISLPDHGFLENMHLSILSDMASAFAKESYRGLVDNHRNAFAAFGIDFLGDMTLFFHGKDTADLRIATRETLRQITKLPERISVSAADELLSSRRMDTELIAYLEGVEGSSGWTDRLQETSVEAQIARAMITYLMTSGAKVEHVLQSGGFNDLSTGPDTMSRLMPRLFTEVFDRAPLGSALRSEINRRLNDQIYNPHEDGSGYILHENFTFEIRPVDGKRMSGFLQFSELHSAGDNPVKNGQAFDPDARQTVSRHSAAIAFQAVGGQTARKYDPAKARLFTEGIEDFDADVQDGGVWRMMSRVPQVDKSFERWRQDTPAEAARRRFARDAMLMYHRAIETPDRLGWDDSSRQAYQQLARSLVERLNLTSNQAFLVDTWVRQYLGKPAGKDSEGKTMGDITATQAKEALEAIEWNISNHYLPTTGGYVALLDLQHLQMIYRANKNNSSGWSPKTEMVKGSGARASSWDSWADVALGTALASDVLFDPLYLLATDGFMHTYQNATRSMTGLPVTFDILKAGKLMDPETNREFVSLSPSVNQLSVDPILADSTRSSLEDLIGGKAYARVAASAGLTVKMPPASEMAKRRETLKQWRKENGVPLPLDTSMKDFRKNAVSFQTSSQNTNALSRMLINLRVGMALTNPALWVSFGPEALIRGVIDNFANLATGQATRGRLSSAQAIVSEWLMATDEDGKRSTIGEIMARTGMHSVYSMQQLNDLRGLYEVLGNNSGFKGMIYRSLMFQRPHQPGMGRMEKLLEKFAQIGSRMQDPTYGMPANALAGRYMEAALEYIATAPTVTPVSIDSLIAAMTTNPEYLRLNMPEVHEAALAHIAQLRSLKPTPLGLMIKQIYDPLSSHQNSMLNMLGNLIKIPLIFSNYLANVTTTILGLQGLSDFTAAWVEGGQKNRVVKRFQAMMQGVPVDQIPDTYDMSEVLESIDLSRSFIRGGVTHTGLFAMGLFMGGLGLTGEDPEERRRRRAAELQGAAFVRDPRKIVNDFRNADALFFKGMPVQMPWIAKQFISPVIGMERFFDTGDIRHITWGFQDALGSFPIVNTMMWNDAVETVNMMWADAQGVEGDDAMSQLKRADILINIVGTYERMLFENSFVNQVYQAADRFDRDPFAQPMLDSDENVQVDAMGQPRKTDAMQDYVDPETGEIRQGYIQRTSSSARLHSFTENRFTMAAVLSLFSGKGTDSSFLRQNMAVKTRSIEAPTADKEQAEAVFRALSQNTLGGIESLTLEETINSLRNMGVGGQYARNSELEPIAKQIMVESGAIPMSILDENGMEVLTREGARGVFHGLSKGMVRLGDPSLRGIHITMEMRKEIAADWAADLIQEGVDMGLDETKATKRMNRIMEGWGHEDGIGLKDIIFSTDIDYSSKLTYKQLNTTFITGPDGLPWATGFERAGAFGAVGLKLRMDEQGFTWGDRLIQPEDESLTLDERANVVDLFAGQNLGLRALEREAPVIPTDVEIGKAIEEAINKASAGSYTPQDFTKNNGSGGGRGGGGGWGGGGGYPNFIRMNPFPDQRAAYGDRIPSINTSNPIIRRASIRRERVWSERGRLKQWQ